MIFHQISRLPGKIIHQQHQRFLWQYVCQAFNRVDRQRLQQVGPDRMCAEWILKNGGGVRFQSNPVLHTDYNTLPGENQRLRVSEIDATKSTIMGIGLEHLKDCKSIRKVILDSCKYLDDEAVTKFSYIDQSLEELKIDRCRNISQEGLISLIKSVPHLKRLELGRDMPLLENIETVVPVLKNHLPDCEITVK